MWAPQRPDSVNGRVASKQAHTANVDVCAQKLREWRQRGSNVAMLDLHLAYLQVHVDKLSWPFQTVKIKGQRYCLTHLGYGLNVAPIIMRSIINMMMAQDETIQGAMSSYIDDIFVNESACTAAPSPTIWIDMLGSGAVEGRYSCTRFTCQGEAWEITMVSWG